jgi:hypothetical protein
MNDDYLWDGSGDPDPEIARLEDALARYRHRPRPLDLPARGRPRARLRRWWFAPSLAAAALALVAVGVWLGRRRSTGPSPPAPAAWSVTRVAGSPSVAGRKIGEAAPLAAGEQLETDSASRAIVSVSGVGQLEIDPNTKLRLVESRTGAERAALDRGVIHAMIWAPPGEFQMSTPSALAVDLGCAYTLTVDEHGAGVIRVTFGWVGFKLGARESFIPEGAVCATRPRVGPGTPYFEDCSKRLSEALERLDFSGEEEARRGADLKTVLAEARPRDALTLWHLLARVDRSDRIAVFRSMSGFVPPPAGVTEEGISSGDQHMLDLWWDKLGYGEMSWWRKWERQWRQQPQSYLLHAPAYFESFALALLTPPNFPASGGL